MSSVLFSATVVDFDSEPFGPGLVSFPLPGLISTSVPVTPSQSTFPSSSSTTVVQSNYSVSSASSNSASSLSSPSTCAASPTLTTGWSTSLSATSGTKTFPSSTSISAASDTKTIPSTTSLLPSSSTSTTAESTIHNKNAIIGGIIGGVVGLLIITALLVYYLLYQSRRGKHDSAHVTAFEVSPDTSIEPTSPLKVQISPHSPAPIQDTSIANSPPVSGSNLVHPTPINAQPKIDETPNQSSSDTTMPQRQSMPHPDQPSSEFIRTTVPTISHNPNNLNPLLREILNVTQGRNEGPSDPGDPNVPHNVHIFIINQPSNSDGSVSNVNGENRGGHYGQSPPRNMDVDTLSLPPSYE